ncbi:MAG: hypothetical protein ABI574_06265 [Burkholderiales bacterium]
MSDPPRVNRSSMSALFDDSRAASVGTGRRPILVALGDTEPPARQIEQFNRRLREHGLHGEVSRSQEAPHPSLCYQPLTGASAPLSLAEEIVDAWAFAPYDNVFPSIDQFFSALRARQNIATAAASSSLDFRTRTAERPTTYWQYREDVGFTLQPGADLVEALRMATQPDCSGQRYHFSCYRASEYVMLLGIAEELKAHNPLLYRRVQARWQHKPIQSRAFHDVFVREVGNTAHPVAMDHYIPGDRVWFKNPDEASSDVCGYEGSWTIYLGGGRFANFWDHRAPYSVEDKCIEIYHWRDGLCIEQGEHTIDETRVARHVAQTQADPVRRQQVLALMMNYRDQSTRGGVDGCIDSTREVPRWLLPATSDIVLPLSDT